MGRKSFYINAYGGTAVTSSNYLNNPAAVTPSVAYQTYLQYMVAAQMHVPPSAIPLGTFTPAWIKANLDPVQATAIFLAASGYLADVNKPILDSYAPIYGTGDPNGYGVAMTTDSRQSMESRSVDIEYLLKVTDNLVWQTNLNYGFDDTAGLQPYTTASIPLFIPYADGSLKFRIQDWENIRDSYNFDNKVTWRFDLGATRHTVQIGQEYQRIILHRPGYMGSDNKFSDEGALSNYVWNHPGVDAPVSAEALMKAGSQSFNIDRKRTDVTEGYYFSSQSRLFAERLILLYGTRYNKFSGDVRYSRPIANSSLSAGSPGGLSNKDVVAAKGAWTPQLGGLFKVMPGLSLFAVTSHSIEPQTTVDYDGVAGQPVKNKNYDLGLKTDLFGGRLGSTVTYYEVDREGLSYEDINREALTGHSPYYIFGNAEKSKGAEFDINWAPVDQYQVVFGWSHILDAKVAKSNDATFVNLPLSYMPQDTFTLWNRYTFRSGILKGLTAGAGGRHNTSARMYSNPQLSMTVPGFTTFDAMLSYKLRFGGRDVTVQFNVKNLQNRLYREGEEGFFDPKRSFYLSVQTRF